MTISSSVKRIEDYAFFGCTALADVYCYISNPQAAKVPTADKAAFGNSNYRNATLHTPNNVISKYKSIEPWCNFGAIVGLDETSMSQVQVLSEENRISVENGCIVVSGAEDGSVISVYDVAGRLVGSALASGTTAISTTLKPDDIGIVKVGGKSIKIVIR